MGDALRLTVVSSMEHVSVVTLGNCHFGTERILFVDAESLVSRAFG